MKKKKHCIPSVSEHFSNSPELLSKINQVTVVYRANNNNFVHNNEQL